MFLALSLDAIAIAGQAIVGRFLGARATAATRARRRGALIEWGVVAGVVLGAAVVAAAPVLAGVFTDDAVVRDLALDPLVVAALQPINGVVFVLDGVLIGAGDARYLALAMLGGDPRRFLPAAIARRRARRRAVALWAALALWMVARLVGMAGRFRDHRWQVTGATRAVT